jgi:hypothetical protein
MNTCKISPILRIVLPYTNYYTGKKEELPDKAILVFMPTFITFLLGKLYNYSQPKKTVIP